MKCSRLVTSLTRLLMSSALIGLLAAGCEGSETGNPTVGRLQLGVRSTDQSIASVAPTTSAVYVEQLWLSLGGVNLVGCTAGALEVSLTSARITGDLSDGVEVGQVPIGEYCGVHLSFEPSALPVMPPRDTAEPASVAVSGSRADQVPFVILSRAPLDVTVAGPAFTVGKDETFLLVFDVAAWLRANLLDTATVIDGTAVLDGRVHPSITSVFESQLTVTLHRDANDDGVVGDDEGALATLH